VKPLSTARPTAAPVVFVDPALVVVEPDVLCGAEGLGAVWVGFVAGADVEGDAADGLVVDSLALEPDEETEAAVEVEV